MKKKQIFDMNKKWVKFRLKDRNPIQEARFKAENGQGINAKVSKKDGETYVEYHPKDWGALLTVELLEAMVKKLGEFSCILANTIKGKGCSLMENEKNWHYYNLLSKDEIKQVREELS